MTCVYTAVKCNHLEVLKVLVEHGASCCTPLPVAKFTPLYAAAIENREDIVEYLLLQKGVKESIDLLFHER